MDAKERAFICTLDAVQDYLELQKHLSEFMRKGFMDLAVARYTMGTDRVSLLQLPATFTSSLQIQENGDFELVERSNIPASASTSITTTADTASKKQDLELDIISQLASKYGCELDEPTVCSGTNLSTGTAIATTDRQNDPIYWFGALVAPSLRQSQSNFKQALRIIMQLASLQRFILQKITINNDHTDGNG